MICHSERDLEAGAAESMRLLGTIDLADYDPAWERVRRAAARAILLDGARCALVYSAARGYYKIPGGGIEAGESAADAMIREVREETGLRVDARSVRPFGMIREMRADKSGRQVIFEHTSYYYRAQSCGEPEEQRLSDSERADGFRLAFVDLREALRANERLWMADGAPFLRREICVMRLLLEEQERTENG